MNRSRAAVAGARSASGCTVVIPHVSAHRRLYECLESIRPVPGSRCEVIVVDNGIGDGASHAILAAALPLRRVRMATNIGFAGAANVGVRLAREDLILILNDDARLHPGTLSTIVRAARLYQAFASFACRVMNPHAPHDIQSAGLIFHSALYGNRSGAGAVGDSRSESAVFAPCGAAAAYRRAVFLDVGGFDESFFAYGEDVDLGLRLVGTGHRTLYLPSAGVTHCLGSSSSQVPGLRTRLMTRNAYRIILETIPVRFIVRHALVAIAFHTRLALKLLCGPGRLHFVSAAGQVLLQAPLLVVRGRRRKRLLPSAADLIERVLWKGDLVLNLPGSTWTFSRGVGDAIPSTAGDGD